MSNTLGDRIKKLRGSLTQRQFAEKIGIPATTLGNYEKNKCELNFATIDLFTRTFGINTDWLIFGRGPMHPSDTLLDHQEVVTRPQTMVSETCARCAKLEAKLEKMEEERRELAAENRKLWKENGELREKCARLEERQGQGETAPFGECSTNLPCSNRLHERP